MTMANYRPNINVKKYDSDFYRSLNGLPLQEESHSRYLATKVPVRKNKDYRARFRNYFIGFPIYKKDHYTRHIYNLKDVYTSGQDAPMIKYGRIYLISSFLLFFLKASKDNMRHNVDNLNHKIKQRQADYKSFSLYGIKSFGMNAKSFALVGGGITTLFFYVRNSFE